jgi:DNA N-6-adenine-methyltransferase (Dam)
VRYTEKSPRFKDWQTPLEDFARWHCEFCFTRDAAGAADDPIRLFLPRYWSKEDNGLVQSWAGENIWCNPPYNEKWQPQALWRWVAKAAQFEANISVLLLPNSVAEGWFHDYLYDDSLHIWRPGVEVRFRRGRINFLAHGEPSKNPPAGGLLAIFRRKGLDKQGRLPLVEP